MEFYEDAHYHERTIYFAESVGENLIKVGRTTNIKQRMGTLRTQYKDKTLVLLGHLRGPAILENLILSKFCFDRIEKWRAEWLHATDNVRSFIEDILGEKQKETIQSLTKHLSFGRVHMLRPKTHPRWKIVRSMCGRKMRPVDVVTENPEKASCLHCRRMLGFKTDINGKPLHFHWNV